MNKKSIKILTIFLIIFICFTMGNIKVMAESESSGGSHSFTDAPCQYLSPMSYISYNNVASEIRVHYINNQKSYLGSVDSYELEINGGVVNLLVNTTNMSDSTYNSVKFVALHNVSKYDTDYGDGECPDYISVTYDGDKKKISSIKTSSAIQYKGYVTEQYHWNSEDDLYNIKTIKVEQDSNIAVFFKDGTKLSDIFTDKIIFINKKLSEKYDRTNYNKFNEMANYTSNNLSENDKASAKKALNAIIDSVDSSGNLIEYNTATINSDFYNATKDKWYNYMKEDLKNPKAADAQRKMYFARWWRQVSTYAFEEDLNRFLEYFNYIYKSGGVNIIDSNNRCSEDNNNCDADGTNCWNKECKDGYNSAKKIIEGLLGYKTSEDVLKKIDKCDAYCQCVEGTSTYNYNKCLNCSNSDSYKTCNSCKNSCGNKCYSYGSPEAISDCQNECEKTCMGELLYNQSTDMYQKLADELNSMKQESADKSYSGALELSKLIRAKNPDLDMTFNNVYKVQCEDVNFLHKWYVAIMIIAPILVIALGSLDFAKATVASDEKKMQEFKSKFPKRLIALFILVIVPIIIKLIISFAGLKSTLMDCIVNGIINF